MAFTRCPREIRTIVDLLQRDHGICWQALLRILVEEEGLRRDRTARAWLSWRWHHAGMLDRKHGGGGEWDQAEQALARRLGKRAPSISNGGSGRRMGARWRSPATATGDDNQVVRYATGQRRRSRCDAEGKRLR
ncbi:hypothetical protein Tdes44962_MAKER02489 [Teratosphaeria destructans]|uniref:Uncharacterized protein n=1 Tax=Teratosphaeria destructans TaxID=418781 RepID=A0A9W7W3D3_9PEZI|nr:hypothetical protein Tdes44962_MAKER02489 [Teratosphaeria destructans]